MKRMMTLLLALGVAALAFSPLQRAAAAPTEYFYDFDTTLAPFQLFSDSLASNVDGGALALSRSCAGRGTTPIPTLSAAIDGCAMLTNATGANFVTMLTQLKGDGIPVNLDLVARDLGGCAHCSIIIYAGSGKPQGIGSFQMVGPLLSSQWTRYGYRALLDGPNPVIAVGIMNVADGLTTVVQHAGIDDLRVQLLDN